MIIPDVNVLVYAYREDSSEHERCRRWLEGVVDGSERYSLPDLVCSGFLRIVTNPAIYNTPSPISDAITYVDEIRAQPGHFSMSPGDRHWRIFTELCRQVGAGGNLVPDAYFAALAIETGSDWITFDRDYARFAGLRWRRPY